MVVWGASVEWCGCEEWCELGNGDDSGGFQGVPDPSAPVNGVVLPVWYARTHWLSQPAADRGVQQSAARLSDGAAGRVHYARGGPAS